MFTAGLRHPDDKRLNGFYLMESNIHNPYGMRVRYCSLMVEWFCRRPPIRIDMTPAGRDSELVIGQVSMM